jgi:hypothetical protein
VRKQLWSRRAMNGAVDTTTTTQRRVGSVDDHVSLPRSDVGDDEVDRSRHS